MSKDNAVTDGDEKPDAAESASEASPRFTPLVIVSMLLGFLLGLGCIFAYVGYERNRGLSAQIAAAREEIKRKNTAIEDMRGQVEALSRQIEALKEYSIARSKANGVGAAAREAKPSSPVDSPASTSLPAAKSSDVVRESPVRPAGRTGKPAAAKETKQKDDVQSCDLVGKPPEEQAATLKRCVRVMDSITETPGTAAARRR